MKSCPGSARLQAQDGLGLQEPEEEQRLHARMEAGVRDICAHQAGLEQGPTVRWRPRTVARKVFPSKQLSLGKLKQQRVGVQRERD